jgi:indolepyruvate ferredoxin oxidoreductase alpha subunit
MARRTLHGGEAIAYGALAAGIRLVASYPGSPSSEVVETLTHLSAGTDLIVEWASNERVALEAGIGVSIAGRRALVCTKSVGMNVMVDPLMALNLTPIHGGLVIILGDDPGGYGSQNDQDTRLLAPMLEMPVLEPCSPAEAFAMTRDAFGLSERFQTPIIIRETRSFSQLVGEVNLDEGPFAQSSLGCVREPWRFVPVPRNAVAKHRALHERLSAFARWAESSPYVHLSGSGNLGILAAGFAARKVSDVIGDVVTEPLRLCQLGLLHPLPEQTLARWIAACRELLVVEETEPFVERTLLEICCRHSLRTKILGKSSGLLPAEGELFRWQIQGAIHAWQPRIELAGRYRRENEAAERPERENHCTGCRYEDVLDIVLETAGAAEDRPFLVGDPGCLAMFAERLDAKYAIGSAIAVAHGLAIAGVPDRVVAIFGDSAFFHSAIPALCHAVVARSPIVMIVLDNESTRTSGNQPHPGVGRDALGRQAPKLNIARISRACEVPFVRTVNLDHPDFRATLSEIWNAPLPALLVVEIPEKPRDPDAFNASLTTGH